MRHSGGEDRLAGMFNSLPTPKERVGLMSARRCLRKRGGAGLFLLVVLGATVTVRADGLPGEFAVTQRWRDLFWTHSAVNNAAFLTEENYTTMRLGFAPTVGAQFTLMEAGLSVPIGLYQTAGVSWLGNFSGSYPRTEISGSELVQTDEDISTSENLFLFTYAINPWNRLSVGANVTLVYQSLFPELGDEARTNIGYGFDLGATYRLLRHPWLGIHLMGLSMQNILAPNFSVESGSKESYARNLKLSYAMYLLERRIEVGADYDIKDFFSQADAFKTLGAGGEYVDAAQNLETELSFRLGVWLLRVFKLYAQFGLGEKGPEGEELPGYWGFAAGMNVPSVNQGRDLEVLYQFNNMLQGERVLSHTIYTRVEVGKHREELYARRMARLLDASPNDLYNKALTLYHQEKYWDAFFIFGQILAQFPDFFKNDWVHYYLRGCQEELDMREGSRDGYEHAIKTYPQSEVVPYCDLGIMRINYRNGNNAAVSNQFTKLNKMSTPDSLKHHAYYLMGETQMRQKNYAKAIQLFSVIPASHPSYVFAQHSQAVAYVLSNNMQRARESLEAAIQAEVSTPEQKEAVNRSLLLIGYLFYEEQWLSKAVTALREIPSSSYYHEDALLGLAWTAVKAQQWGDCLTAARNLQKTSEKLVLQSEAALLEAYGLLMQQNYSEAVTVLQMGIDKINKASAPDEDQLAVKGQKYQNDRIGYNEIAESAYELAMARQSELVVSMIDSLHTRQKSARKEIDDYLKYADEFERMKFFARNIETVKSDMDYALATAENLKGQKEVQQVEDETIEEQQDLQQEIEKIREEMEQLEQEE